MSDEYNVKLVYADEGREIEELLKDSFYIFLKNDRITMKNYEKNGIMSLDEWSLISGGTNEL